MAKDFEAETSSYNKSHRFLSNRLPDLFLANWFGYYLMPAMVLFSWVFWLYPESSPFLVWVKTYFYYAVTVTSLIVIAKWLLKNPSKELLGWGVVFSFLSLFYAGWLVLIIFVSWSQITWPFAGLVFTLFTVATMVKSIQIYNRRDKVYKRISEKT
tara:strand:- start:51 stop:518 length:468 start_codon:yes stop_codon:yes gene_type:complete